MSMRELLEQAAAVPSQPLDITEVWVAGRRRRVRAYLRTSFGAVAVTGAVVASVVLGGGLTQSPTIAIEPGSYPSDQREELISCLSDHGFKASPQPDGSLWIDHADAQRENVSEALGVCIDRVAGRSTASESQIRAEYQARLADRECLVEAGYEVAPAPPWERFRDQYGDGDQNNDWYPIEHVYDDVPHEELFVALDTCRRRP